MENRQESCRSDRIALYFSGRVYGFDQDYLNGVIKSIETSFNQKVDIFISSNSHRESFDQFVEKFKPVKSEFRDFVIPPQFYQYSPQGRFCVLNDFSRMFFHNNNCFNMIKEYMHDNNINYKIVVKFRGDILSNDVLPLNEIIVEPNTVYIPNGCDAYGGLTDIFAYGDFKSMELYSNIWTDIPHLVEGYNCPMHPETLLWAQLKVNNINVKRFKYKYMLNPKRKPGIILGEHYFQ